MKIEVKVTKKPFGELFPGDLFIWSGTYCMKMEERSNDDKTINAVDIYDGAIFGFNKHEEVMPVNAKVLIL